MHRRTYFQNGKTCVVDSRQLLHSRWGVGHVTQAVQAIILWTSSSSFYIAVNKFVRHWLLGAVPARGVQRHSGLECAGRPTVRARDARCWRPALLPVYQSGVKTTACIDHVRTTLPCTVLIPRTSTSGAVSASMMAGWACAGCVLIIYDKIVPCASSTPASQSIQSFFIAHRGDVPLVNVMQLLGLQPQCAPTMRHETYAAEENMHPGQFVNVVEN